MGIKIKHKSSKTLRKKLWKIMSEIVRRQENGVCYTCGDKRHWKDQNAGHYIHRDCLDFEFTNIHCQCVRCNKYLSGNTGVYAEKLIQEYGIEEVKRIRELANKGHKFSVLELEEMIPSYQRILDSLI